MALKTLRCLPALSLLCILLMSLLPIGNAQALDAHLDGKNLPVLESFAADVSNGQADELRGIYIPDILAARVIQQPAKSNDFVSLRQNTVTQFGLASQFGSIGLLAHNYLAGENFFLLNENQIFYLIYGDGSVSAFIVTKTLQYQALDPTSTTSNFRDLTNDALLTATQLFSKVYNQPGQVTLQTCINRDQNPSWGRLFVIAEPYSPKK